jgi:hypothetical protein
VLQNSQVNWGGAAKMGRHAGVSIALLSALLVVLGGSDSAFAARAGQAGGSSVGLPVSLAALQLHVKGKPVSVYAITRAMHIMNVQFQPVGLKIVTYIQVGASGHAEQCKKWFNQVIADIHAPSTKLHPYLEISTKSPPVTSDEGKPFYQDGDAECWEAMDFYGQP